MITLRDFEALVLAIQRASLDPCAWQDVVDLLAMASHGAHTHLYAHDLDSGTGMCLDGSLFDPEYISRYDAYFHRLNAWTSGFETAAIGSPVLTRRLMPFDAFEQTEFYNDWVRPQGDIIGGAGMVIRRQGGRIIVLGGNIRRRDMDALEAPFVEGLTRLAPYLAHSVDVSLRIGALQVERAAVISGVDPDVGIFVLSECGSLVYANDRGVAMLEDGTVVRMTGRSMLALSPPRVSEAVMAALRRPPSRRTLSMDAHVPSGRTEVRLVAFAPETVPRLSLPLFSSGHPPAALLAVSARRTARGDPLASLGLTRAEAEVVRSLAEGHTPTEIAARRASSVHTVRNQIKSALSKTGSRRQAELVAIVGRLARR